MLYDFRFLMSLLCLGSLKGSHLMINTTQQQQLLQAHPATDDGFIHVVAGIVKNSEGKIYLHHSARLNEFLLPGGKLEHGETLESALYRELSEELEISVQQSHHISSIKYIIGGLKRCCHLFEVDEYTGIPGNTDHHKYDQYRAKIIDSDNDLGFAVAIDGTVTDDVQDIMQSFLDLYHIQVIAPQLTNDLGLVSQYLSYDASQINGADHYYLYLDTERQLYSFSDV